MLPFLDRYKKLNKEQKLAVDTVEGPVLVVAGPGSGKTEILGLRVANILRETDAFPSNVLCVTFSESASITLRRRLIELIGRDAYRVSVHTFHNFGVAIRQEYPEFFYGGNLVSPSDDVLQRETIEELLAGLSHKNPLSVRTEERGFIYLKEAKEAVSHLKNAGITPDEFKKTLAHNEKFTKFADLLVNEVFGARINKETVEKAVDLTEKLKSFQEEPFPLIHMLSLKDTTVISLEKAIEKAQDVGKATPLSDWKGSRLKITENGTRVLKESANSEKTLALADIYESYQNKMREKGYYDFDDMIMDAIQKVDSNDVLRAELQERFRYILVDEFQDTNDAQMRLIYLLADSSVNEGKPNIMVVGDDDQAIYKFQGAEISNISNFKLQFPETKMIVLTKNYRSRKEILDFAVNLIRKGEERLEKLMPGVKKDLIQANDSLGEGELTNKSFATQEHEYYFISAEIEKMIKNGTPPSNIAVIAREHKNLENIARFLNQKKIPYRHKRRDNVLARPHIRQLIRMLEFTVSLARKEEEEADWLLPDILQYPFWELDRRVVWELSMRASKERKPWLGVMLEHSNKKVRGIADFFIELAGDARSEPFEYILDKLVGTRNVESGSIRTSPFKEFYFPVEKLEREMPEYLVFLSNLKFFMEAVREHKQSAFLRSDDILKFIKFHEKNKVPIADTSPFIGAENAVELITAHDAKGRQFDTVFVIGVVGDIWAKKGIGSSLSLPLNLPIAPTGDTLDDKIRLFFVAVTRAKCNLIITSHRFKENGRETTPLVFLDEEPHRMEEESIRTPDVLFGLSESRPLPPFVKDEKSLLRLFVEEYKMSATHLNNFLDVQGGGPLRFLEQNILRFPHTKTPSLSFGTAMHSAVEYMHNKFKQTGTPPSLEEILIIFREKLWRERLSEQDRKKQEGKGIEALGVYYEKRKGELSRSDMVEVNFRNEGVVLEEAHLTGKIDKISFKNEEEVIVYDFKTGKSQKKWEGGSLYEKIKLHKYEQQLAFYKILFENSKRFEGKKVAKGVLEFLEPKDGEILTLSLDIKKKLLDRTTRLAEIVYGKIKNLEFPDVESYSKDVKGIIQFEDDLLEGKL